MSWDLPYTISLWQDNEFVNDDTAVRSVDRMIVYMDSGCFFDRRGRYCLCIILRINLHVNLPTFILITSNDHICQPLLYNFV